MRTNFNTWILSKKALDPHILKLKLRRTQRTLSNRGGRGGSPNNVKYEEGTVNDLADLTIGVPDLSSLAAMPTIRYERLYSRIFS